MMEYGDAHRLFLQGAPTFAACPFRISIWCVCVCVRAEMFDGEEEKENVCASVCRWEGMIVC